MYNYIRGEITQKDSSTITIEVAGVGYSINASPDLLSSAQIGTTQIINVYLQIKEDSHTLYGFRDARERELFLNLLGVSGVGAKTALALLAIGSDTLALNIANAETSALSAVKGISQKTAEKIVVELRKKMGGAATPFNLPTLPASNLTQSQEDAVAGLCNLGVSRTAAVELVRSVDNGNHSAEQLIVAALKAKR
jgi:Holliday junction DNA helicase RuvA